MTVKELIAKLSEYNPNATVWVHVHNSVFPFELLHGGREGCTPTNCSDVDFSVDSLNQPKI